MVKRFLLVIMLIVTAIISHAQQKIKVACIGNSITEGHGLGDSTYPAHLQRLLGDKYEVRNFGRGGRTLLKKGDYPYWNETTFTDAKSWEPNIVIIKLGTNDSKPHNWKYGNEFYADYAAFVNEFRQLASKPKIYVCHPVPVFKDNFGIREAVVKDEIIPIVKKLAKAEKLKVIDLYTALKPYGSHFPDGVHPDKVGATIMANTIYKAIR